MFYSSLCPYLQSSVIKAATISTVIVITRLLVQLHL